MADSTTVERIEVFSWWRGFARPPSREAKLVIARGRTGYIREQRPHGERDEIPDACVQELLAALSRPLEPQLNPRLFDLPESAIRSHYNSQWTDDYPAHLIRITLSNGAVVEVHTDSQHAFMLPLQIGGSGSNNPGETFDPRLSRAVAALMPDDYLDKERLDGRLAMLGDDLEECAQAAEPSSVTELDLAVAGRGSEPVPIEAVWDQIDRILSREESAEEKLHAERTGKLSERLLKRIPVQDVLEVLEKRADPGVADDVGQTALMHAAFPPFDAERFWLLANAGADLEASRQDGLTGLHLACEGGEVQTAAAWVRAGANVNARTPEGATPLMLAALWPEIAGLLLDAGAEVNAVDRDGHSALAYAILQDVWRRDRLKTIRALIRAGADLNLRDHQGISALDHAHRMLAQVRLSEEVRQAFQQSSRHKTDRSELKVAQAVVELLTSAVGSAD